MNKINPSTITNLNEILNTQRSKGWSNGVVTNEVFSEMERISKLHFESFPELKELENKGDLDSAHAKETFIHIMIASYLREIAQPFDGKNAPWKEILVDCGYSDHLGWDALGLYFQGALSLGMDLARPGNNISNIKYN